MLHAMTEEISDQQLNAIDRLIIDAEKVGPDSPCSLTMSARTARAVYEVINGGGPLATRISELEDELSKAEDEAGEKESEFEGADRRAEEAELEAALRKSHL